MNQKPDMCVMLPASIALHLLQCHDTLMKNAPQSAGRDAMAKDMEPHRQHIINAYVIQEQRA